MDFRRFRNCCCLSTVPKRCFFPSLQLPWSQEATAWGRDRNRSHVWEPPLCVLLDINSWRADGEKMAEPFFIFTAIQAFKGRSPWQTAACDTTPKTSDWWLLPPTWPDTEWWHCCHLGWHAGWGWCGSVAGEDGCTGWHPALTQTEGSLWANLCSCAHSLFL